MFELYATGNYSINALVEKMFSLGLRNRGGNKVGRSRMHDLLSDPFYYGKCAGREKSMMGNKSR